MLAFYIFPSHDAIGRVSDSCTTKGRAGASLEMEIAIINACTLSRAKIRTPCLFSNPSAKLRDGIHKHNSELECL